MLLANPLYQLEKTSDVFTDEALQLLTDADGRVYGYCDILSFV